MLGLGFYLFNLTPSKTLEAVRFAWPRYLDSERRPKSPYGSRY